MMKKQAQNNATAKQPARRGVAVISQSNLAGVNGGTGALSIKDVVVAD